MPGTSDISVRVKVMSDLFQESWMPSYASTGAAGMDLHACLSAPMVIAPVSRVRIPTGIAIELPSSDMVALVYARSGLAWRHGISLPNGVGVIDSDYTGEVQVMLLNQGDEPFTIEPGDRIAQLVVAPIYLVSWTRAEALSETHRGDKGFGSTGV